LLDIFSGGMIFDLNVLGAENIYQPHENFDPTHEMS
jgi:hypothetical protein